MKLSKLSILLLPSVAVFSLSPPAARAQSAPPNKREGEGAIEHTVVLGVGGAAEIELADGSFHPGANVMLEWEAIENWLEIELDASILAADHGTETPIGLTFKKPFRLAPWAELMIGIGPEIVYVSNPATRGTFVGGEAVVDFMVWPTQRFGFWLEPSYDVIARDGVSQGVGTTGGVLVGW